MSELGGLLLLAAGLSALAATGALAACCLRLASALDFLLAAYVIAWAWLVAVVLALSPAELVSRGSLLAALAFGLIAAAASRHLAGRPRPPSFRPGLRAARRALRVPAVAVLAVGVALAGLYGFALAFLTPANEGDALAYHLARASFWKQDGTVGYVAGAVDLRLDASPPNAEIGQLATMLLSGSDRYVALPQLAAYGALVVCVAALTRRLGLTTAEALFGALVFATLPVVAIQASGALNDLVAATFLAIAATFAVARGRAALVLAALALALALGTKFTAVLALPALAAVAFAGPRRREWPRLLLAGVVGAALGSVWYVLNVAETGDLDGGLAADAEQRVALAVPAVAINLVRYGLDLVDMTGLGSPYNVLLVPAALATALLVATERSTRRTLVVAAAVLLTLAPLLLPSVARAGESATVRMWAALGRPETAPFERGWGVNTFADSTDSWYGPVGFVLLLAGAVAAVVLWRGGRLPAWGITLAAAPWILLATLALTVVWDPWRGRLLIFGVALAAATWGVVLRWRAPAAATAVVAVLVLGLSLANLQNKPSGLWDIWAPEEVPSFVPRGTVWDDRRAETQARTRPAEGEELVYEHLDAAASQDARITIVARENEFLSPYFGPRLSRHVSLVRSGDPVPASAEWLVAPPSAQARRCEGSWRTTFELDSGWRVERRIAPDACSGD